MSELLPCPFCGHTGVTVHEGSTFRWRYAACDNCGAQSCEIRIQTLGDGTKEEWEKQARIDAVTEWNTRAVPVEVRKVNAAGRETNLNKEIRTGTPPKGETTCAPATAAPNTLAEILHNLTAVLCNPDGNVCIAGSNGDKKVIADALSALRQQAGAGMASISEFEQIVNDESAQWKGTSDDTHGAQTACQMILQKIATLKERTE